MKVVPFLDEYVHWSDPAVGTTDEKELSLEIVFRNDSQILDGKLVIPVFTFNMQDQSRCRSRWNLCLSGFDSGEVNVERFKIAGISLLLVGFPLVHPLTISELARIVDEVDYFGGKLVLVRSTRTDRIYLCSASGYRKYLAAQNQAKS